MLTFVDRKRSSGKSGCFSPKTQKSGVRNSFRGFLRRLSGGKNRQVPSVAILCFLFFFHALYAWHGHNC